MVLDPYLLNVLVNALVQQSCNPELVDVQGGRVHVVEHHRVAQLMVRLPVEGAAACRTEVQDRATCRQAGSQLKAGGQLLLTCMMQDPFTTHCIDAGVCDNMRLLPLVQLLCGIMAHAPAAGVAVAHAEVRAWHCCWLCWHVRTLQACKQHLSLRPDVVEIVNHVLAGGCRCVGQRQRPAGQQATTAQGATRYVMGARLLQHPRGCQS